MNSLDDFATFYARLVEPAQAPQGSDAIGDMPHIAEGHSNRKTVLVIGAGLIGCDFANDLLQAGYRVHVVDPSPRPLAALLPQAAGLADSGVRSPPGAGWKLGGRTCSAAWHVALPGRAGSATRLCTHRQKYYAALGTRQGDAPVKSQALPVQ